MAENKKAKQLLYPRSGIPQGSHIGPILYLIYSNDINKFIQESSPGVTVLQFADDTKILYEVNNENDRRKLQSAINSIVNWGTLNRIALNKSKTCHLSVGRKQFEYFINEQRIPTLTSVKDLGIIYDDRLNFKIGENNYNQK